MIYNFIITGDGVAHFERIEEESERVALSKIMELYSDRIGWNVTSIPEDSIVPMKEPERPKKKVKRKRWNATKY